MMRLYSEEVDNVKCLRNLFVPGLGTFPGVCVSIDVRIVYVYQWELRDFGRFCVLRVSI